MRYSILSASLMQASTCVNKRQDNYYKVRISTGVYLCNYNHTGGLMVSMFASNLIDCGIELRFGQTKDNKMVICCLSSKHSAFRSKSKNWLAHNQANVSEWRNMSTCSLLFQ